MTIILALVCGVALLSATADRVGIPSSILLLIAGILISFTPGIPSIAMDPELVLLLLLPPLLYSSGVGMSWRGFSSSIRPILLLAVGCVLFTAISVAAVAHFALGLPWTLGIVLGAIVSPPDAVAPMAILRRLALPRRLLTVLEGESLVNDATALVLFSFAIGAVATDRFSPLGAATRFGAIVGGEIAWGIAVGWAMLGLRHVARDPRAEVLLALATPFLAFWPPHGTGGSGVIACVAAGLYVSWNGRRLIRPETRLQGFFIWSLVTWAIEGIVFLVTGLQASAVLEGVSGLGMSELVLAGIIVSATVIIVRFAWIFPAMYVPRRLSATSGDRDRDPGWRLPFIMAFSGLRGVVSLAAASSIPLTIGFEPFPERALMLFLTFCVIAATVIGQGLALPWMVQTLGLTRMGSAERRVHKQDEQAARLAGLDAVLEALDRAEKGGASRRVVDSLRRRNKDRRAQLAASADTGTADDPVFEEAELEVRIIEAERKAIGSLYEENRITDEARRRIEREFDLEEARARYAAVSGGSISVNSGDRES